MSLTLNLGRRIELVSMDPHFENITIGLYEQQRNAVPEYLAHSYSGLEGARQRVDFVIRAMAILGGLNLTDGWLSFPCHTTHQAAVRRAFLEACKLPGDTVVAPKPLTVVDKKLDRVITVASLGAGLYEISAAGPLDQSALRVDSITNGLRKLGEMQVIENEPHSVKFPCGQSHDVMVGLLLPRALNVRAVIREEEMAASRGLLVAPSAQQ